MSTGSSSGTARGVGMEVSGLQVRLGGDVVLGGVDLSVEPGSWLGVLGPNGAGKTTLLRVLAGLLAPSAGSVRLAGAALHEMHPRERARWVGYLPQAPMMPEALTVTEYVLLGRAPYHSLLSSPRRTDRAAVARVLERLQLRRFAHRRLGALSGGERQRVALARVLAQEPRVMLLDEPTAALDLGHAQQVLELIDRIRCEDGTTVVTTLHDLVLAGQYADPLALLAAGRLVAFGAPAHVLTAAALAEHYEASALVHSGPDGVRIHPVRP